jgi:23S rRNA (guanosine2251-2'-O)-methyltransferase
MKPPSSKGAGSKDAGGRSGSGAKPYRPGGPRPSTPRPYADKPARPDRRTEPKPAAAAVAVRPSERVSDRPVLTIATKGAFGRPEPVQTAAPVREERPLAKRRPYQGERTPRAPVVRHDIDAPRGTIWLYGIHAIGAALQNPQRRLRRLLLTEDAEAALTAAFSKPWPIPSESTERARLDLLLGQNVVHQGAALLADPLGSPSLQQALERPGPVLVLDQVSDPRNVGAILRSAAVFGASCVITQDRNAPDESGALAKAASGALEKMPLLRAVNIARTLVALKAAGCWVVGLDAAGKPLSGPALAGRRVALVLGSEGEGLRRLTKETCDELAGIPMSNGAGSAIDSLNVSAAGTVALYELSRTA